LKTKADKMMTSKDATNAASQRADRARDKLLRFRSAEEGSLWFPAWSSFALERTLEEILNAPDAQIADVFRGLWAALNQNDAPLNKPMANFLLDIVRFCFGTKYRPLYQAEAFEWMIELMDKSCTEAQAYLAAFALPPKLIPAGRDAIIRVLSRSAFLKEVGPMLEAETADPQ
jgi:hypothetical protein